MDLILVSARRGMSSAPSMPSIGGAMNSYGSTGASSPQLQSSPSQASPASGGAGGPAGKRDPGAAGDQASVPLLPRPRLQDLVREIDPTVQIDEEVEELMLQLADDFIDRTLNAACQLAKHRHAPMVEVKDVQLHLERQWNMWIPGFGNEELRPYKRATVTEAHKQRLALIRKAIKKY